MPTTHSPVRASVDAVATPVHEDHPAEYALDQLLAPEVAGLFAEVDAILRIAAARLIPRCRPPAPPATGRALLGPRSAGRAWQGCARPGQFPLCRVRATQRSPPLADHETTPDIGWR
jgi:hypothetical protein